MKEIVEKKSKKLFTLRKIYDIMVSIDKDFLKRMILKLINGQSLSSNEERRIWEIIDDA